MSISTIISKRVRKMNQRERVMLNIGLFVLIWGLIDTVTIGPSLIKQKTYRSDIAAAQESLTQLKMAQAGIDAMSSTDPDAASKEKIKALEGMIDDANNEILQFSNSLVPASDMPKLLDEIISRGGKVKVVSLETIPDSNGISHPGVNVHALRVTLEGKYIDLIERLQEVESSKWKISWDELELSASGDGVVQVSVVVHTLSLEDAWLSV